MESHFIEAMKSQSLQEAKAVWMPRREKVDLMSTWRIIPVSKGLVTPIYKPWNVHLEKNNPS